MSDAIFHEHSASRDLVENSTSPWYGGRRTMRQNDDELRCSFCGKSQNQVKKLIAGPSVWICKECVDICSEIVADDHIKHSGGSKMEFIEKSCVRTTADMNRVLARMSSQIVENNPD